MNVANRFATDSMLRLLGVGLKSLQNDVGLDPEPGDDQCDRGVVGLGVICGIPEVAPVPGELALQFVRELERDLVISGVDVELHDTLVV